LAKDCTREFIRTAFTTRASGGALAQVTRRGSSEKAVKAVHCILNLLGTSKIVLFYFMIGQTIANTDRSFLLVKERLFLTVRRRATGNF
jgi:hypothetical protein